MAERTVIYYDSGSGNSLSVAKQVAEKLGHTDIISIYNLRDDAKVPEEYDRVGICTPTFFTQPPRIVKEACEQMELLRSQKVFVISTAGGGDGFVRYDLKEILTPKTDHPVQTFFVRMPPNHIVGFDPFPDDVANGILTAAKETTTQIAEDIRNDAPPEEIQVPDREELTKLSRAFNSEKGVDRDSTACEFYASDACAKCGTCVTLCKNGNITLTEEGAVWGPDCQQCMACILWCPSNAVRHPNVPEERRRYRNPDITLQDMLSSEFLSGDEHEG